MLVQFEL